MGKESQEAWGEPCWEEGESEPKKDTSVVSIIDACLLSSFFVLSVYDGIQGLSPVPTFDIYENIIFKYDFFHARDYFLYCLFKIFIYGILHDDVMKSFCVGKWLLWWNKFIYALNQNTMKQV